MESIIHETDLDIIINFLLQHNIISNKGPFCTKCNKFYEWRKRGGTSDKYTWRCTKCDTPYSIRKDSILEGFKIPIIKIVKLIHAFAFEH